jgi:starch synthase (maltosyl-transferring)
MVVNLAPDTYQQAQVRLDLGALGLPWEGPITVHDLLTGHTWAWGPDNFVSLSPDQPAHILAVVR